MCQWIASLLVSSWEPPATTATLETSAATQESPERDTSGLYPVCQPEGARLLGGEGPPGAVIFWKGKSPSTMEGAYALREDGRMIEGY